MPNAYGQPRTAERDVAATYRMRRDEKERLRREAAELGLTAQQLFELRMFGQAKPVGVAIGMLVGELRWLLDVGHFTSLGRARRFVTSGLPTEGVHDVAKEADADMAGLASPMARPQRVWGKPRSTPDVPGSGQRAVTTFVRV